MQEKRAVATQLRDAFEIAEPMRNKGGFLLLDWTCLELDDEVCTFHLFGPISQRYYGGLPKQRDLVLRWHHQIASHTSSNNASPFLGGFASSCSTKLVIKCFSVFGFPSAIPFPGYQQQTLKVWLLEMMSEFFFFTLTDCFEAASTTKSLPPTIASSNVPITQRQFIVPTAR
jgi:hypothetical protein